MRTRISVFCSAVGGGLGPVNGGLPVVWQGGAAFVVNLMFPWPPLVFTNGSPMTGVFTAGGWLAMETVDSC